LAESHPKIHHDPLPLIRLCPRKKLTDTGSPEVKTNVYYCPIYRTQARSGMLLPTGHSTNYIFMVELPTDKPPDHWINRGVAGIAQKPE
jgi:dynein heavy chain